MKNRSLILGACAIVFASASAFTFSNKLVEQVFVEIKTTANTSWHCQDISQTCSNTGSFLCAVNVTRDTPVPATVIKTNGRTTSCEALLNSTAAVLTYNPANITITDVRAYTTNP